MRASEFLDSFSPPDRAHVPARLIDTLSTFDAEADRIVEAVVREAKDPKLREGLRQERLATHREKYRRDIQKLADNVVMEERGRWSQPIGETAAAVREDTDPGRRPALPLTLTAIEHETDLAALEADLRDALLTEDGPTIRAVQRVVTQRLEALDHTARRRQGYDPKVLTKPALTLGKVREVIATWQNVTDLDVRRRRQTLLERPSARIQRLERERDAAVTRLVDVFQKAVDFVITSPADRVARRPQHDAAPVQPAPPGPGGIVMGRVFAGR